MGNEGEPGEYGVGLACGVSLRLFKTMASYELYKEGIEIEGINCVWP